MPIAVEESKARAITRREVVKPNGQNIPVQIRRRRESGSMYGAGGISDDGRRQVRFQPRATSKIVAAVLPFFVEGAVLRVYGTLCRLVFVPVHMSRGTSALRRYRFSHG